MRFNHLRRVINIRNEELIIEFGKHIRVLRKERKLSMEKLAELADIEYKQLSRIERGEINPTISTAYVLAKALNVPLKDLFTFQK